MRNEIKASMNGMMHDGNFTFQLTIRYIFGDSNKIINRKIKFRDIWVFEMYSWSITNIVQYVKFPSRKIEMNTNKYYRKGQCSRWWSGWHFIQRWKTHRNHRSIVGYHGQKSWWLCIISWICFHSGINEKSQWAMNSSKIDRKMMNFIL